ncbi:hypothetical protein DUI70_2700 [Streptomyces albus]|nr:hypothetical protein DUI70_2700 [Streptomyces albus]
MYSPTAIFGELTSGLRKTTRSCAGSGWTTEGSGAKAGVLRWVHEAGRGAPTAPYGV